MATSQVIQAEDKKFVGINRFTGPYTLLPPSGLFITLTVDACRVVVTAQGVANSYRVCFILVELTIGLIDQIIRCQLAATSQGEWVIKMGRPGCNQADTASRGAPYRLV